MKDFFVSYNGKDKEWAEWIAWQLEAAGYTTVIQAWDFRPGGNFVIDMQRAAVEAQRTIAVLSQNYLDAMYTQPEWTAAFAQDPTGAKKTLLPVRIQECDLKGMLSQIVYIDLVGKPENDAREVLLTGLQTGRAKPSAAPGFPQGQSSSPTPPRPQTPPPAFPVAGVWGERFLSPAERETILQITNTQIGGVNFSNISGGSINIRGNVSANVQAGGDIVGRDKIVQKSPAAENDSVQATLQIAFAQWQREIETKIAALSELDEDEKEEIKAKAAKVEQEVAKGKEANVGKIERLLNTMSNMAPDILEVTATTLQNPFKGVGLVLQKINDRIKLERQSNST